MNIKTLKVGAIKPYLKNARVNKETIAELADSIKRFGYKVPITIDRDDVIVTGHARLLALKKLKYKEVDCIVLDLSDEKIKEFRILDNKIHDLSGWDEELLNVELRGMGDGVEMFPSLGGASEEGEQTILTTNPVTANKVVIESSKQKDKFGGLVDKAMGGIVKVKCGHCSKEFNINKKEFDD